jgi:hypothetical protein
MQEPEYDPETYDFRPCPNCGQSESDPTDHGAACKLCGSDGHAACQHADSAFDAAFGSDHTAGNADMADTMDSSYEVWAELQVEISEGVSVNIGWHRFTITADRTELDIPAMYGETNGQGNPRGGWSSVITVLDSYAA